MGNDTLMTAPADSPASTTETSHPETQPSQAEVQTGQGQTTETTKETAGQAEVATPYTITVPEGMVLNESLMASVTPIFQEMGLNNEQVQTLSDAYAKFQQTTDADNVKAAEQAFQEQNSTWQQEVKADKELGGLKHDENLVIANQALKQFTTPEYRQRLEETGEGNYKETIRAWYKVGKELVEGRMISGQAAAGESLSLARKIFTTMDS